LYCELLKCAENATKKILVTNEYDLGDYRSAIGTTDFSSMGFNPWHAKHGRDGIGLGHGLGGAKLMGLQSFCRFG
jgi:hypothetical protein